MDKSLASIPFGYTPGWASAKDKYDVKHTIDTQRPPLRLGLVGLGGIALGKHLPAIRRLQQTGLPISLVAGSEVDKGLRSKCELLHSFRCYADFREMFRNEELDAIEVLTDPGENRLPVLEAAVDCGLHLFVEKPFLFFGVTRLEESIVRAEEIVRRAREKHLVVMTGFVKQYSPPYALAHQLVAAGAIGTPALIAIKMCQGYARHMLLEGQACHLLHIALWIGGPIAGIQAFGINRFAEPHYPYDNIVVNAEFASGAIGSFYFNSSSPTLKPWERFEVFGNRKWLIVEDGFSVTLHDNEEGPSNQWAPVIPHTLLFDEEFGGFTGELRAFTDAVREHKEPPITGEDGIEALVLAQMIHTSIRERRYVSRREMQPPVAIRKD